MLDYLIHQAKRSCVNSADGVGMPAMASNPIETPECRFVGIPELTAEMKQGPLKFTPLSLLAFRKGRTHGQF